MGDHGNSTPKLHPTAFFDSMFCALELPPYPSGTYGMSYFVEQVPSKNRGQKDAQGQSQA